jgi:hypothetical protein
MGTYTPEKLVKNEFFMSLPLNMLSEEVHEALQEEDAFNEALEFWFVTNWLCEKLRDQEETVIEHGWHNIWLRTTSGQPIKMDRCIQRIIEYINNL